MMTKEKEDVGKCADDSLLRAKFLPVKPLELCFGDIKPCSQL